MTLQEWRLSDTNRKLAQGILDQPTMREMLNVLLTEHPGRKIDIVKDGFEATLAVGRQQGYQLCLAMLESLAIPMQREPGQVSATWGAEVPPPQT